MTNLSNFLTRNIREIEQDPALRAYGAALALGQFLTYIYWITGGRYFCLSDRAVPLCWPFFENCHEFRFLDPSQVLVVLHAFGLLALVNACMFLRKKTAAAAYSTLVLVNIVKMAILFQDFHLRMNQHYMLFFMTLAFLFFAGKRGLLRYTLVMFYVWAGGLKLNAEWLSGKALYGDPLGVHGTWIPPACWYVVFLELLVVWGTLSRNAVIYWASLVQILAFHIASWTIVGFFYPLLMMLLWTISPLAFCLPPARTQPNLLRSLLTFQLPASAYGFLVFFCALQMVPRLFPGNTAITGEGRLFALHMLDAQVVCGGQIVLRFKDRLPHRIPLPVKDAVRIQCDPLVMLNHAKWYCRKLSANPDFADLDISYQARLSSQTVPLPVMDVRNFCSQDLRYDLLRHNDWILTGGPITDPLAFDAPGHLQRMQRKMQFSQMDMIMDALGVSPGMVVLDIGTSHIGEYARAFARRLKGTGLVVASDFDRSAVAYIRQEARKEGLTNLRPLLVRRDGPDPALAKDRYDLIFLSHGLQYLYRPLEYLKTLREYLRPQGRFVLLMTRLADPLKPGDITDVEGILKEIGGEAPFSPFYAELGQFSRHAGRDLSEKDKQLLRISISQALNRLVFSPSFYKAFIAGGQLSLRTDLALSPLERQFADLKLQSLHAMEKTGKQDRPSSFLLNQLLVIQRLRPFLFAGRSPYSSPGRICAHSRQVEKDLASIGYRLQEEHVFLPFEDLLVFSSGQRP